MEKKDFNKKIFSLLFILAIIFFLFENCKKIKKEEINPKAMAFSYTSLFFKSPAGFPNFYFQKGWKKENDKDAYLLFKKEGIIRFQVCRKKDLVFKFSLKKEKKLSKIENPKIQIYLNGILFKVFPLKYSENNFELNFLKEKIKSGDNFLKFKLICDNRKRERLEKKEYDPEPYLEIGDYRLKAGNETLRWERISETSKKERVQRTESEVFYYFRGKRVQGLKVHLKLNTLKNHVKIMNIYWEGQNGDKGILKKVKLKNGINVVKLNLKKFRKKILYRLIFTLTDNQKKGDLFWKNVSFLYVSEENLKKKNLHLKTKPNIYYILLDALRADMVGRKINNIRLTTTIDKFSMKSFSFDNFYTNAPYTRASVATLFTGLLPETHGVRHLQSQLPSKIPTLARVLKHNGYETIAIYGTSVLVKNNLINDFDRKIYIREKLPFDINDTSVMNRKILISSIKELKKDKPKFVYIHILPPHEPYNPSKAFRLFVDTSNYDQNKFVSIIEKINYYENVSSSFLDYLYKGYLNNVVYADFLVSNILRKIKSRGEFDDSLIIITSDHGEAFFEHNKIGHNSTNYQEMIHIPFFIKLPEQKKGNIISSKKSVVDVFPTILELLGIEKNDSFIQGKSFADCLFNGKCSDDEFVYSRTDSSNINVSIIWKNYKYINYFGRDELYDLKKDPKEKKNIAVKYPFITGFLRQESLRKLYKNIKLRKLHKIPVISKKFSKEDLKQLRSLGYL